MVTRRNNTKPTFKPEDGDETKVGVGAETGANNGVGTEIGKEDEKIDESKVVKPLNNAKKASESDEVKKGGEIDVESLSDEQLARLAQRMGVVYNAPKAKIGNRKCFLKIYKDLPVIHIGKAREGQVHDPVLNVMVTKLLYPITTMDGTETKITHDEYNSLERREFEFTKREDLSEDIPLGDPIYNGESKEYVDNVRKETRERFLIKIDEQLVEVYSDGGAINA